MLQKLITVFAFLQYFMHFCNFDIDTSYRLCGKRYTFYSRWQRRKHCDCDDFLNVNILDMAAYVASPAQRAASSSHQTLLNPQFPVLATLTVIRRNGDSGLLIPIRDNITIGRDPSVQLHIDLPEVSPNHAEITFDEEDQAWITNFSEYGTFVNGADIGVHQGFALGSNDLITICNRRFRFDYVNMKDENVTEVYICRRLCVTIFVVLANGKAINSHQNAKRYHGASDYTYTQTSENSINFSSATYRSDCWP